MHKATASAPAWRKIEAWIEPAAMLLVAPFALFPSPARFAALLLIPAVWLWQCRASRHFVPRTPLDIAVLLLVGMVLASVFATYDIAASLPKIAGVLFGVGVYYAIARACALPRAWQAAFGVFVLCGIGVAALGLLGTRWPLKLPALEPVLRLLPTRLLGLAGAEQGFHANEVAGAILWAAPPVVAAAAFAPGQAPRRRGRWLAFRIFLGAAAALLLTVLVITQSRSSWVAFGAAMMLLLAAVGHRSRLTAVALGLLVALALAVVTGLAASSEYDVLAALNESGERAFSLDTLETRLEIWTRALYGLQDFPIGGMGMNTFRQAVHVLYPMFNVPPNKDIGHAHNAFVQAGLDLGLPGLVAFGAIYVSALWMSIHLWRRPRQAGPDFEAQAALGLGIGLVAHLIYSLTDAIALGAKPGVLFWMSLGLLAALHRRHRQTAVAERPKDPMTLAPAALSEQAVTLRQKEL